MSSHEELLRRLDEVAEQMWPMAHAVSNMRRPETDNNYGRAAVAMREAAAAIREQAQENSAMWDTLTNYKKRVDAAEQALESAVAAMQAVVDGNMPRPLGKRYYSNGKPSKYDWCIHDKQMAEECENCIDAYLSEAIRATQAG